MLTFCSTAVSLLQDLDRKSAFECIKQVRLIVIQRKAYVLFQTAAVACTKLEHLKKLAQNH